MSKDLKEITITSALEKYTSDSKRLGNKRDSTIRAYCRELEIFIEFLKNKNISTTMNNFNRENILDYLEHNKNKAVNSKNRFITIIKNFTNYCMNIMNLNIDSKILFIPHIKQKKQIKHILTDYQIKQLKDYVSIHRDIREQVIVLLFLRTGIRLNEGIHLKWENIDFKNNKIYILNGKTGDRVIPLHPELKNILEKYKNEKNVNSEYVITGQKQKTKMSKSGLSYLINSLVEKAGLPDYITPHTFRHTFATQLLRSSGNLEIVKKVMGHSDISITQLYLHIDSTDTEKAIFNMD